MSLNSLGTVLKRANTTFLPYGTPWDPMDSEKQGYFTLDIIIDYKGIQSIPIISACLFNGTEQVLSVPTEIYFRNRDEQFIYMKISQIPVD